MSEFSDRRVVQALIRSAQPPSREQRERFVKFVAHNYSGEIRLSWDKEESITDGFILQVGSDLYDWSLEGRIQQMKEAIENVADEPGVPITTLIRQKIESFQLEAMPREVGRVLTVGDGIATVDGLSGAAYGEILVFENGIRGMIQDLRKDYIGCVLLVTTGRSWPEAVCIVRTGRPVFRSAAVIWDESWTRSANRSMIRVRSAPTTICRWRSRLRGSLTVRLSMNPWRQDFSASTRCSRSDAASES